MSTPYDYAKANQERFLDEYQTLLRIRTISTQPQHADDVADAAEWLKADDAAYRHETRRCDPDARGTLSLGAG